MSVISPRVATRISEALPEALRPTWMHETWTGVFGAGGLASKVTNTTSEVHLAAGSMRGSARASGNISSGGKEVGSFVRDMTLHPNGRMEVHHSWLRLTTASHGTGFARAFNEHAWPRYADAGVDDVSIYAALSVGGYAWARQGFELTSNAATAAERLQERGSTIRSLVDGARSGGRITEEEFSSIAGRLLTDTGALPEHALVSVQELAALPFGKRVLLGQSWNGAREIERTAPWWSGRTPVALSDAANGASHLIAPALTTHATNQAGRALAALLPEALDPNAATRAFERRVGGEMITTASSTSLSYGARDALRQVSSHHELVLPSQSRVALGVSIGPEGALVGSEYLHDVPSPSLRRAFNAAWRDLGVTSVVNRSTDKIRTVG